MTPKQKFNNHRGHAKHRNIPFLFTFDEWWDIWQKSGHWEERGTRKGQYCMSRVGDTGPYAVGNVYINTNADNVREAWQGKSRPAATTEHKIKNAIAQTGKKQSPETIAKKVASYKKTLERKQSPLCVV